MLKIPYLALRQLDIRGLQNDVADLGLSSLGRLEGHVLVTLEAVLSALHALAGRQYDRPGDTAAGRKPADGGFRVGGARASPPSLEVGDRDGS